MICFGNQLLNLLQLFHLSFRSSGRALFASGFQTETGCFLELVRMTDFDEIDHCAPSVSLQLPSDLSRTRSPTSSDFSLGDTCSVSTLQLIGDATSESECNCSTDASLSSSLSSSPSNESFPELCGFQVVGELEERLRCTHCRRLLRDAVQTACGHLFCAECAGKMEIDRKR